MTTRLAIFDCDGTLVDSQHSIVAAMQGAFDGAGLALPDRAQILSIVGLSLPEAMARLLPEADVGFRPRWRSATSRPFSRCARSGTLQEPLYDGMAALLDTLAAQGWLLAVATGKSDRGLSAVLAHHGLAEHFVSRQTADHHPSQAAPRDDRGGAGRYGRAARAGGDDRRHQLRHAMARTAGVAALGVGWGYHPPEELLAAGARSVAMDSAELARHIGLS